MGGHALVVRELLESLGFSPKGYLDDSSGDDFAEKLPYLGSESSPEIQPLLREHPLCITVGTNAIRARLDEQLSSLGGQILEPIIHPTAYVSDSASLAAGTQVLPQAAVNARSVVGRCVIINTSAIVEHECQIGDYCHLAPGSVLAGNVTLGKSVFVGANASIIQGIKVGEKVIIGAGAVVIRDVPAGATVVGNPARIIKLR
ncbi:acetyltransferase [Lewinella sp. 4G2]|uniref:acetyltransferase n=1 Tax=Lewinella sp. 4G2 TaxID=1803372 RepID=UPI0018D3C56F|nr:acetyltransferase [Lewinella sp. 4G2]